MRRGEREGGRYIHVNRHKDNVAHFDVICTHTYCGVSLFVYTMYITLEGLHHDLHLFPLFSPQLLREMTKVMRECWYYTSTARPTAVYLKKKLLKMSQELENMPDQEMMPCKDSCSDKQCDSVYVSTL